MPLIYCFINGFIRQHPHLIHDVIKLSKIELRAAPHHSSAIFVKRNILTSTFKPHTLLNRQAFDSFALDFLMFGNAYLEERKNLLSGLLRFKHIPAKYTRRGIDENQYWFAKYGYESEPYPFQ